MKVYRDKVETKFLSESGRAQYICYLRGTANNYSANRILRINGSDVYNTSGRGIRLTVYNSNMVQQSDTTYDILGSSLARTELASALYNLNDSYFYFMTSYDAIKSDTILDSVMYDDLNSQHWRGEDKLDIQYRSPYACVGRRDIGMLSEVAFNDAGNVYAELYWTYEPTDDPGEVGYQQMKSDINEYVGDGSSYRFIDFGEYYYSDYNINDLEYVLVTCDLKVDLDARLDGVSSRAYIYSRSPGDGWVSADSSDCVSTQWTRHELRLRRDDTYTASISSDGLPSNRFTVACYHMPSSKSTGNVYIRNVQIAKAGYLIPSYDQRGGKTQLSDNGMSCKWLNETAGSFSPFSPYTYYNLFNSDRNIVRDETYTAELDGSGTSDEDVEWFGITLTESNEKVVHWKTSSGTSGANMYTATSQFDIDPEKFYYFGIWHYSHNKSAGRNYLGCNGYYGGTEGIYYVDSNTNKTNPYFYTVNDEDIEFHTWRLWEGYVVPYSYPSADGINIRDNVSNIWAGYDFHNPNNNSGTPAYRWRSDNDKSRMRWLDYYNNVNPSHSWWALPLVMEIPPLAISDLRMFVYDLQEVL